MYAVIFEVEPKPGHKDDYLGAAARLKSELEAVEGLISVERFASLSDDNKLVSLSFWQSAEAIERWRRNPDHMAAQALGICHYFTDFRIRVARVERDYCLADRRQQREDDDA